MVGMDDPWIIDMTSKIYQFKIDQNIFESDHDQDIMII